MNQIIAGGQEILIRELEKRIRAEVQKEGKARNFVQFEREVKRRLAKEMPSSQTLY